MEMAISAPLHAGCVGALGAISIISGRRRSDMKGLHINRDGGLNNYNPPSRIQLGRIISESELQAELDLPRSTGFIENGKALVSGCAELRVRSIILEG